jgi:hypothetical protein
VGVVRLAGSAGDGAVWCVFISRTSELREFPAGTSYVAAVERTISAAGHVIVDMADFDAATWLNMFGAAAPDERVAVAGIDVAREMLFELSRARSLHQRRWPAGCGWPRADQPGFAGAEQAHRGVQVGRVVAGAADTALAHSCPTRA